MRQSLFLLLLMLSLQSSAQKPSLSASEEQDQPQSLLLSLTDFDLTNVVSARLFSIDGDYSIDAAGQLVQASRNVTTEFLIGSPTDAGMGSAIVSLRKPLENRGYVIVLQLKSGAFASAKIDPKG